MKFSIHNKVEIKLNNTTFTFFNNMFKNVYEKFSNFESFNNYLSIGNGPTSNKQNEFKLTNLLLTIPLKTEIVQNDISKGQLYIKKSFIVDSNVLNDCYITEMGITDTIDSTTIYNYFSLITDEQPHGVRINTNEKLCGVIYIYLDIENQNTNFSFLDGDNKFISYLLGEGLHELPYVSVGDYYINDNNEAIFKPNTSTNKILSKINFSTGDVFNISFVFNIKKQVVNSLFLFLNNTPFAFVKTQNYYNFYENDITLSPKQHYVIDMGENIKTIKSITNNTTGEHETSYFVTNYANEIGAKVNTTLFNSFDNKTPRYVSNDGRYIIFVQNKNVHILKNENYCITKIDSHNLTIQEIKSINCVDDFIFIFSNIEPYLFVFKIFNNEIVKIEIDFSNFDNLPLIKNMLKCGVSKANSGEFMIGIIDAENQNGNTLYFSYDSTILKFNTLLSSNYNFTYILPISSNKFCDAHIIYCKEGEYSYTSKLVTHYANKTEKDVYTSLAYTLTNNAKELYVKDRGIIVEKTEAPKIQIYHYPHVYQYLFPEIENEQDYYLSNNLLYMAVRKNDGSLHFYNLVGYNETFEFLNNLPEYIQPESVQDIVFLKDSFLVFTPESIFCFNLKQNKKLIENISSVTDDYLINYDKYRFLGENNEEVVAKFSVTIDIWFFLILYTKSVQETI